MKTNPRTENQVTLEWGSTVQPVKMECGCGYVLRWGLPCRHVLAVCESTNTLDRSLTLTPESFRLENYRSTAYTPALKIVLPTWGQLTRDKTRCDPPRVKQAGAPTKGRPRKKRIPGVGDYASSSKYNTAIAAPAPSSTT
ncbi:unnamed protein product, partial [Sphacelaria rigidula]